MNFIIMASIALAVFWISFLSRGSSFGAEEGTGADVEVLVYEVIGLAFSSPGCRTKTLPPSFFQPRTPARISF